MTNTVSFTGSAQKPNLSMTDHIIELEAVSKTYNGQYAVETLSLTLQEGQLLTLLGPSGCGKTTTLRLIAGIVAPDGGAIRLSGRHVAGNGAFIPPEQRRVGLVFQDYALFPHLSVAANISFGLKRRRLSRKEESNRVEAMLQLVGMSAYGDRMPHMLSGGQQQRVALARALAPEPDIMLLDEPFSNLDTALRTQVRAEVRSILRAAGTTTVFVTHDQQEALSLSDQVAVMFDGRLHQMGTPEELYTSPVSKQVAQFMGEANFLKATAHGSRALTPLGEIRLLKPQVGEVELLIRPEMLHLNPADEGVAAEIEWREYYGHAQRVGLKLGDGTQLVARSDAQVAFRTGDNVRVSVYAPLLAFQNQ